ncbi:MAG: hypothetical protein K8S55_16090 [Phycisphaerae bacterium]|nr:hypothetical protein [Phycisphaerae bacterium]
MSKHTKLLIVLVSFAVVGAMAVPAVAQVAKPKNAAEEAKRLAMGERAARADAIRKLGERIRGLRITSSTTVQDFVAENDTIETDLNAFLKGMKQEGKCKVDEDGVVTCRMSVTLKTVETTLKRIYTARYKGDKVKINDFNKMTQVNKFNKIEVVGQGVLKSESAAAPIVPAAAGPAGVRRSTLPPFWKKHIPAGFRAQAKTGAERAARVDAMRRLAERIKGVRITSSTTVQDFVTESDEINVDMRRFLRGAKEIGVRYRRDILICEVEMQVTLKTVITNFKSWVDTHYKGDRVKIKQLQEYVQKVRFDKIKEIGTGVVNPKYVQPAMAKKQVIVAQVASQPPAWIVDTLRVKGRAAVDPNAANPAQARLAASRAAALDARRKIAEKLNGLMLSSNSSVKNFAAQSDKIQARMQAFQQNAAVVDGSEKIADGVVTVTVEMDLKPVWDMVVFYRQQGTPLP